MYFLISYWDNECASKANFLQWCLSPSRRPCSTVVTFGLGEFGVDVWTDEIVFFAFCCWWYKRNPPAMSPKVPKMSEIYFNAACNLKALKEKPHLVIELDSMLWMLMIYKNNRYFSRFTYFFCNWMPSSIQNNGKSISWRSFICSTSLIGAVAKLNCILLAADIGVPEIFKKIEEWKIIV